MVTDVAQVYGISHSAADADPDDDEDDDKKGEDPAYYGSYHCSSVGTVRSIGRRVASLPVVLAATLTVNPRTTLTFPVVARAAVGAVAGVRFAQGDASVF